ncbi:hypothetical protein DH2020_004805 [Rehmannia glutinosa]|uniref:Uncharacterized protein n=1 Tax=Rehmannia glutinosa TaxID=99300 RepID=A0ABR0XQM9_REHGL
MRPNRCNCFNGNSNDNSDDEFDFFSDGLSANSSFSDPCDTLKTLRKSLKRTKLKRKDDLRKIVTDGLIALGYNASVCKSKWEKSSSIPAGNSQLLIFHLGEGVNRRGFPIGVRDRPIDEQLQGDFTVFAVHLRRKIRSASSNHLRRVGSRSAEPEEERDAHRAVAQIEYMKSKWLSPHTRIKQLKLTNLPKTTPLRSRRRRLQPETKPDNQEVLDSEVGELDLIFGEKMSLLESEESKSPAAKGGSSGDDVAATGG